ncbi:MAG: biotin synthase BioB [Candidatus Marinimicrobia bacterium]|nr:biotin synthase BioB [Candidatus Neomarinimicrobiota bacterium]
MSEIRSDWTFEDASKIYHQPLLELIYKGATVHRQFHEADEVQVCTLLSVKTGGCPEDCGYCPQAARYHTDVEVQKLLPVDEVVSAAKRAKQAGSTRFCMGAAWREVKDNADFDNVLDMISQVSDMGLEVCGTLGMATEDQLQKMKNAGLHAYNHNVDTSEDFYGDIISTRNYDDRLDTLKNTRNADITICSGGIIGMGETDDDRIKMLLTLATFEKHPESVPINALVSIDGTPLEDRNVVSPWEMARMIATARIMMPESMVRLSAGRTEMSPEAQALCFMAGANSIFSGDKLLTTPNPSLGDDEKLFSDLGLHPRPAYKDKKVDCTTAI